MIKQDYLIRMIQEIISLIVNALLKKKKYRWNEWTEYDGQMGLLRLAEVWSAIRAKEGMGGLVLEGTEAKILSDVVAQFYAYLSGCMFNDPVGMAIYAELHYMMSSLMLGEWFE